jgi:CheY-like chemotaxis protein
MPDKDGYEVCRFVRQHETLSKVPVIPMSGIVNQSVAERAMTVKADELIRKPFQPQDLIARIKGLIGVKTPGLTGTTAPDPPPTSSAAEALSSLFSVSPLPPSGAPAPVRHAELPVITRPAAPPPSITPPASTHASATVSQPGEVQKLRNEILRLELLVRRLQAELAAGRDYCSALEAHFKRTQEPDERSLA